MSFSYANELSEVKDQLRFLVQDTVDEGHFFEDEEITFVAGQEPNLYRAAACLCRTAANKILKDVGYDNKRVEYDPEAKAAAYRELAESYDDRASSSAGLSMGADAILGNIRPLDSYEGREPTFTRDLHIEESDDDSAASGNA
jgi:hypothetical protein